MSSICEYCKKEIVVKYASGRFCNKSCYKGFCTKAKRKEINEKVSKKLGKYKKPIITIEEIKDAIYKTLTMAEAAKLLNITYNSFIRKAKKFDIYVPNQGGKGKQYLSLEEIFSISSIKRKGEFIKPILFKHNLKQNICENCGITEWCRKNITLELEHINGNNKDNRLDNLKILCPNCHSQTKTFRRKKSSLADMM